ncbi:hypothetical protein FGO68_gene5453 [Halteria grandinella]|uniref:GOLD domain-containing protein n=1 Tax=Halteria grandinella TaxID=5974 RepID=A0A8J8SZU5_HALGN|nr:hypothetical protein FGO68_gene5453 [Halteria grandinella]
MKSRLSLLSLLACCTSVALAEKLNFQYTLSPLMNICFLQNIAENIQAITEVTPLPGQSQNIQLTVNDPKGRQLASQENQAKLRYQFTSYVGGNHQVCVLNRENQQVSFEFMIQTGVEAKDYSNIITKKHLRPIEVQAQKVQDMVRQLRQELSYLVANEESLKEQNQKIKSRVLIFGVISVLVMGASTYLQISYLKNFFRYKKII